MSTPSTASTPSLTKFSPLRVIATTDDLSAILASLLHSELGTDKDAVCSELKKYLGHHSIISDTHLLYAMDPTSGLLPDASSTATAAKEQLPLLSSIPVANTLLSIVRTLKLVHSERLYLTDQVSFADLQEIERSSFQANGRPGHCTGTTTTSAQGKSLKDLPVFKLKDFSGRDEDGPEWAAQVESMFRQNGMQDFLEDSSHCQANIEYSDALAERLRAALKKGDQSATAEQLKTERDCSVVWKSITLIFDSDILKEAKQLRHWLDLFELQVNDLGTFETYLNKLKESIIYLKNLKSTAISDSVLMRAVITRGVDVPELHTCMLDVVKDQSLDSNAIIAKMKREYQALEKIDSGSANAASRRKSRRAGTDSISKPDKQGSTKRASYIPKNLPSNTKDVFSDHYFVQIQKYWKLATNPNRSEDEEKALKSFRFKPENRRQKNNGGSGKGKDGGDSKVSEKKRLRRAEKEKDANPDPKDSEGNDYSNYPPPPPNSYYPPHGYGWNNGWNQGNGGYYDNPPPPQNHDYQRSTRRAGLYDGPPQRHMFSGYHNARNSANGQGSNRGPN